MTRCFCGMDHAAERLRGAEASRHRRAERYGPPFETIADGARRAGQPTELRARQTEDGAWEASVFSPEYEEIPQCEVGGMEFVGLAATEDRARALARQAAATAHAKWAGWREKREREQAARTKENR